MLTPIRPFGWSGQEIHSQAEKTTPVNADLFVLEDSADSWKKKKVTLQNLMAAAGSGDVVGPSGATANAVARWDGVTGKLLKDSSVVITDAGRVGIFTADPQQALEVNGSVRITSTDCRLEMHDTTGDFFRLQNQNGVFKIVNSTDADREDFQIDGDGKVGIGVIPSSPLTVAGTADFRVVDAANRIALVGLAGVPGIAGFGPNRRDIRFDADGIHFMLSSSTSAPTLDAMLIKETAHVMINRLWGGSVPVDVGMQWSGVNLFDPQAYIDREHNIYAPAGTSGWSLSGFRAINNASLPFSKVIFATAYNVIYSDYIPVMPGERLYGEIWAMRNSAGGDPGVLYYGIERYDKDLKPIGINNGTTYFVASTVTVPVDGVWHKYSAATILPTSHTPYDGSDGGPVRYVRVRILINHDSGTVPTHIGGILLRRATITRDDDIAAISGKLVIGSNGASGASDMLHVFSPDGKGIRVERSGYGVVAGMTAYSDAASFGSLSNHPVYSIVNNAIQGVIDTGGRWGLGTSSPESTGRVTIDSGASYNMTLTLRNQYGDCTFGPKNASGMHIYTGMPIFWFNKGICAGVGAGESVFTAYTANDLVLAGNNGNTEIMRLKQTTLAAEFRGNVHLDNSKILYAKNTSGTYEQCLIPLYSNNCTYFTFGSGGALYVRNSSLVTCFRVNADKAIDFFSGTAPTANVADAFRLYSADQAAGNACPHFRTENGGVVKLYRQTAISNPASTTAGNNAAIISILGVLRNLGLIST